MLRATSIARTAGSKQLLTRYFFVAAIYGNNTVTQFLKQAEVDVNQLRAKAQALLPEPATEKQETVSFNHPDWRAALAKASRKSDRKGSASIQTLQLWIAVIEIDPDVKAFFKATGIGLSNIRKFEIPLTDHEAA